MKQFALLISILNQTSKPTVKEQAIVEYLKSAPDSDKLWAIHLLSGNRPKRLLSMAQLKDWGIRKIDFPLWLIEESHQFSADWTETLSALLPTPSNHQKDASLTYWMEFFQKLSSMEVSLVQSEISIAWKSLSKRERWVFNKLITGGFRWEIPQKLLANALGMHLNAEANGIVHRLTRPWTPNSVSFQALFIDKHLLDDHSKPYPFNRPISNEDFSESLGQIDDWQVEWKWEGIPAQLIKRGGEIFLWSDEEELITNRFPEINIFSKKIPDGTVMVGEFLSLRGNKPIPFHLLQSRMGRKKVNNKMVESMPMLLMTNDLLESKGKDIRALSLIQRRHLLESLINSIETPSHLAVSPVHDCSSWEEVESLRSNARTNNCSGVVIKKTTDNYHDGIQQILSTDPFSVDAVLMYTQKGSDAHPLYSFGVWKEDMLVPIAKIEKGLSEAECAEIEKWAKSNVIEKFGPVRSLNPKWVFEITFSGIHPSPRHKSGIALRQPIIHQWKRELKVSHAGTLSLLTHLLDE